MNSNTLFVFLRRSLCSLISYLYLASSSSLTPLVTTGLFSTSVSLFLFCYIYSFVLFSRFHICDNIEYLSFSVRLMLQNTIPSRSISVLANSKIHSFLWLIFHYVVYTNIQILCAYIYIYLCVNVNMCVCVFVCIPHRLYPFIYWWALRLLSYLGYCKWCCYGKVYFLNGKIGQ